jgi:hypothetical protein
MSNKVESLVESIDGWIERVTNFEKSQVLTEALHYHIDNGVPLYENIFRCGSEKYFQLFNYARQELNESKINLSSLDKKLLTETDIGLFGEYKGNKIPLDYPMMESEEELTEADYHGKDVELNKPKRGGSKKYYVYVKDPKTGNVKKINFGDTTGLTAKINNPKARKSFVARHKCDQANDKTTANYWSCRLPHYAKSLGLSGGGNYFW